MTSKRQIKMKDMMSKYVMVLAAAVAAAGTAAAAAAVGPEGGFLAVREGRVIIPRGQTVIHPEDHIIIFTRREAIPKVEKALMVKLEYF